MRKTIVGLLALAAATWVYALGVSVSAQPANAKLYAGTNSLTTGAEILAASTTVVEVLVQNDPDSTTNALVGSSAAQTIELAPGDAVTVPTDNLATVYVKAVSGTPTVNYLARTAW